MHQPAIARRIGQQQLHRTQNIVVAQRLTVVPVSAAAQVKMPTQSVLRAGPVVRQIGHRLRLARFITG
ncbi:hypothetical protein D3C76_1528370 [compost metagenome]